MTVTAIDTLLGVETLTGLVKTFADQADNRACTELFQKFGRTLLPAGDTVGWEEVEFSRHLAPVAGPDSPHTRAKLLGRGKRSSAMAWVKAYKDIPSSHLFLHRAPGSDMADAEAVLAMEAEDLGNIIQNTREYLAAGALLGLIDVNPQTVPGSEVSFKVDFGNHAFKALAPWDDKSTKIRSVELVRLKKEFKDTSGMRAEVSITTPEVEGFLTGNDEVRELSKEQLGAVMLRNLPPNTPQWEQFGGMSWRFCDGVYRPEGQPVKEYFPTDKVVVLPSQGKLGTVLGWAEAKTHVPAGPVFGTAQAAAGMVKELRGTYAYAELRTDPLGIRLYAGWAGLPIVLNPRALTVFQVRP